MVKKNNLDMNSCKGVIHYTHVDLSIVIFYEGNFMGNKKEPTYSQLIPTQDDRSFKLVW